MEKTEFFKSISIKVNSSYYRTLLHYQLNKYKKEEQDNSKELIKYLEYLYVKYILKDEKLLNIITKTDINNISNKREIYIRFNELFDKKELDELINKSGGIYLPCSFINTWSVDPIIWKRSKKEELDTFKKLVLDYLDRNEEYLTKSKKFEKKILPNYKTWGDLPTDMFDVLVETFGSSLLAKEKEENELIEMLGALNDIIS